MQKKEIIEYMEWLCDRLCNRMTVPVSLLYEELQQLKREEKANESAKTQLEIAQELYINKHWKLPWLPNLKNNIEYLLSKI